MMTKYGDTNINTNYWDKAIDTNNCKDECSDTCMMRTQHSLETGKTNVEEMFKL